MCTITTIAFNDISDVELDTITDNQLLLVKFKPENISYLRHGYIDGKKDTSSYFYGDYGLYNYDEDNYAVFRATKGFFEINNCSSRVPIVVYSKPIVLESQ